MVMNFYRVFDARFLQKMVIFLTLLHSHLTVLPSCLIIVTVCPKDTYADQVLFKVISTAHVRTGKKTEAARIDLKRLVNRKF